MGIVETKNVQVVDYNYDLGTFINKTVGEDGIASVTGSHMKHIQVMIELQILKDSKKYHPTDTTAADIMIVLNILEFQEKKRV